MDWCVRSLHAIQDIANKRRRNYILDQVNSQFHLALCSSIKISTTTMMENMKDKWESIEQLRYSNDVKTHWDTQVCKPAACMNAYKSCVCIRATYLSIDFMNWPSKALRKPQNKSFCTSASYVSRTGVRWWSNRAMREIDRNAHEIRSNGHSIFIDKTHKNTIENNNECMSFRRSSATARAHLFGHQYDRRNGNIKKKQKTMPMHYKFFGCRAPDESHIRAILSF